MSNIIYNTFNGHTFYDDLEKNNFDYSTVGDYGTDTYRKGLTADGGSFGYGYDFISIYNRDFIPYLENPTTWITFEIYEGATFTYSDNSLLPNSISTDDTTWEPNTDALGYYYSILFDGGIGALDPMVKAVTGVNTLSARFTYSYDTSAAVFDRIDGNYFSNPLYS